MNEPRVVRAASGCSPSHGRAPAPRYTDGFLPEANVTRLLPAIVLMLSATAFAQQSVPEISYDSAPNFFKLPPDMNLGEGAGVAVNSKGHIFVFTRSNSATG